MTDCDYEMKLLEDQLVVTQADIEGAKVNCSETEREIEEIKTFKQMVIIIIRVSSASGQSHLAHAH